MNKVVEIQLEWKYTPEKYFEEPVVISLEGVEIEIANGIALANIEPKVFEGNNNLSNELGQTIERRFCAAQIMTHADFELSKPSRTGLMENGERVNYVDVDFIASTTTLWEPGFVVKDKDGNIISDAKKDRLNQQEWIAKTLEKFSEDKILLQMFKSYQMSVKDPDNEFVHLYEVRDALSKKFGKPDTKTRKKLNITKQEWKKIGDLACKRPLRQGRHRGQSAGVLRDATQPELENGRESVRNLIVKYLEYLDKTNCP